MNYELNRYLDGEIDRSQLSPENAREAAAWDDFLADVRDSGVPAAPAELEARIMTAIRAEKIRLRIVDWWARPRSVRVRPWLGLAAAAVVAAFLLVPGRNNMPEMAGAATTLVGEATTLAGEEMHYVQFRLEAPGASSVHLAGDFNDWKPEIALADPHGTGVWSGRVHLSPGIHHYMFLVDGESWVTDPHAMRFFEDDLGKQHAVIAITGGGGARSLAP